MHAIAPLYNPTLDLAPNKSAIRFRNNGWCETSSTLSVLSSLRSRLYVSLTSRSPSRHSSKTRFDCLPNSSAAISLVSLALSNGLDIIQSGLRPNSFLARRATFRVHFLPSGVIWRSSTFGQILAEHYGCVSHDVNDHDTFFLLALLFRGPEIFRIGTWTSMRFFFAFLSVHGFPR